MASLILWHGSKEPICSFRPEKTVDRGFHCGSREQAEMRNAAVLHKVELGISNVRRSRDRGGDWARRIADARRRGFSAIVYLNRWEGIPAERIEQLSRTGQLDQLDRLGDRAFKRLVPEAQDSYIALSPDTVRILETIVRDREPDFPHVGENTELPFPD
ncbi:hypothetical protein [Leisingera caerulea]|uniref:hypothetical protein n=1 Tax=Leisingera caerulea TaxID=506591 RepID=UPI0012B54345|nr:hypothetical protein [Leisingera caerulea]